MRRKSYDCCPYRDSSVFPEAGEGVYSTAFGIQCASLAKMGLKLLSSPPGS